METSPRFPRQALPNGATFWVVAARQGSQDNGRRWPKAIGWRPSKETRTRSSSQYSCSEPNSS